MTRRRRLAAAAVALAAALGCHRPTRPPSPTGAVQSPAQAIAIVGRRQSDTRTMTATFQLLLRRPDGREEHSRGAVVVARPDRLRLQLFSFGVMTVYDYTVDGDRYRVRRPLEGVEKTGRFDEAPPSEREALGADLRPLFLPEQPADSATVRDGGDRYVVSTTVRGERRDVEVSKRDGVVSGEALYAGVEPHLIVRYGDYGSVDDVLLPYAIDVRYPAKSLELTIHVTRYTRNQAVDPHLFEF